MKPRKDCQAEKVEHLSAVRRQVRRQWLAGAENVGYDGDEIEDGLGDVGLALKVASKNQQPTERERAKRAL